MGIRSIPANRLLTGPQRLMGNGSPNTVVTATAGSTFQRADGAVLRDPAEVSPGDALRVRVARGELHATVTGR